RRNALRCDPLSGARVDHAEGRGVGAHLLRRLLEADEHADLGLVAVAHAVERTHVVGREVATLHADYHLARRRLARAGVEEESSVDPLIGALLHLRRTRADEA